MQGSDRKRTGKEGAGPNVNVWQSSQSLTKSKLILALSLCGHSPVTSSMLHCVTLSLVTCHLLEGELGVAGGAGKTVDTPSLVEGGHH